MATLDNIISGLDRLQSPAFLKADKARSVFYFNSGQVPKGINNPEECASDMAHGLWVYYRGMLGRMHSHGMVRWYRLVTDAAGIQEKAQWDTLTNGLWSLQATKRELDGYPKKGRSAAMQFKPASFYENR